MNNVGYAPISAKDRRIKNGSQFDHLIPMPSFSDEVIKKNGSVNDTVRFMLKIVEETSWQVAKVAKMLKADTITKTCQNIYNFVFKYIKYNTEDGEILRSPRNSWYFAQCLARDNKDVKEYSADCDCMSIFIGSLLRCCNIAFQYRIAGYDYNDYGHVYTLVPLKNGNLILDTVYYDFNLEKDYTKQRTFNMNGQILNGIDIRYLDGIPAGNDFGTLLNGIDENTPESITEKEIKNYLIATRNLTNFYSQIVSSVIEPKKLLEMLNYALKYWDNEKTRKEALIHLHKLETELIKTNKLKGIEDEWIPEESIQGLGDVEFKMRHGVLNKNTGITNYWLLVPQKGMFATLHEYLYPNEELGKLFKGKLKAKIANSVGNKKGKLKHALNLANPITIACRSGLRVLFGLNFMGASTILADGLLSEAEAKAKGFNIEDWKKKLGIVNKIKTMFYNMGGTESKIVKSIRNGSKRKAIFNKNAKGLVPENLEQIEDFSASQFDDSKADLTSEELTGLAGLGEVVTLSASITAAGGVFKGIWSWLKQAGLLKKENRDKLKESLSTIKNLKQFKDIKDKAKDIKNIVSPKGGNTDADSGSGGNDDSDSGSGSGGGDESDNNGGKDENGDDTKKTFFQTIANTISANRGKAALIGGAAVIGLGLLLSPSLRKTVGLSGIENRRNRRRKHRKTKQKKQLKAVRLS